MVVKDRPLKIKTKEMQEQTLGPVVTIDEPQKQVLFGESFAYAIVVVTVAWTYSLINLVMYL